MKNNMHDKEYYIQCYKQDIKNCRKMIADIEKKQAEDAANSKAPDFKLESEKSKLTGLMKKSLFLLDMIGESTDELIAEESSDTNESTSNVEESTDSSTKKTRKKKSE